MRKKVTNLVVTGHLVKSEHKTMEFVIEMENEVIELEIKVNAS